MSTETQTTETKVEKIVTQPEKETLTQTTEVDYEAELAKKDADLAQIATEKENYRKAYLKVGGKLPVEDDTSTNEEDLDAKIDRKVQERILATREATILSEKDALVKSSAKKIKELTLALKNRGQISTTSGQGSNEDKPEVKADNYFSTDQINALKAKGWDDKKIEAFKKNVKNPGFQSPK